jgi:hypothetical protein
MLNHLKHNKIHSLFPMFFFLSLGRQVWTNNHTVKDYNRVTFPVILNMAPYAFLTKIWYPYQLAVGISHPAIPERLRSLHGIPQNIRPTDSIE